VLTSALLTLADLLAWLWLLGAVVSRLVLP